MKSKNNNFLIYKILNNIAFLKLLTDTELPSYTISQVCTYFDLNFDTSKTYEEIIIDGNGHQLILENLSNDISNETKLIFKNFSYLKIDGGLFYNTTILNSTANIQRFSYKLFINNCIITEHFFYSTCSDKYPSNQFIITNSTFNNCYIDISKSIFNSDDVNFPDDWQTRFPNCAFNNCNINYFQ